ncbi:site-specific integrase [Nonomuraea sp. PA05]|nr:site-specific integrase [Nonomuraea sp. PA05]
MLAQHHRDRRLHRLAALDARRWYARTNTYCASDIGARCPKLRRANGSWNPHHGTWHGKEEIPAGPDGKRIYLRLGGFASETELSAFYEKAGRLLDLPEPGPAGHQARVEILSMIKAAHRKEAPLPGHDEVQRRFRTGQPLQSMTFGEYWSTWVERRRRLKDVRASTLTHYITHHDVHFGEVLDEVRLDRIFVPTIEGVFARIDEKNAQILAARRSGDPEIRNSARGKRTTGPATKQRIKATIRSVLADAMREHLVTFNAAALMHLPAGRKPKGLVWTRARVEAFDQAFAERLRAVRADPALSRREKIIVWACTDLRPSPVMVWTPAQLGTFLDHAVTDRLYALFHLIALRGLRRGEACGARWTDLDTDDGTLAVTTQLTVVDRQVEEGAPKTESSDSLVALDKSTLDVLHVHHARQRADRLRAGPAWRDSGRIFTKPDGSPLHPDVISKLFARLSFAAGLPPIRLHDLRHGAATLSLAAGNDMKVTSAMLRHASLAMTSDLYTAVLPDVAHAAAEASAALVPRTAASRELSATRGLPSVSPLPFPPHHPAHRGRNRRSATWPAPGQQPSPAGSGDAEPPEGHGSARLEAEPLVQGDRPGVRLGHVEEGPFATCRDPLDERADQPGRVAPSARLGRGADGADLGVSLRPQPLTRHRHQPALLADAEVGAELTGTRPERPRLGAGDEVEHLGHVVRAELAHAVPCRDAGGSRPDELAAFQAEDRLPVRRRHRRGAEQVGHLAAAEQPGEVGPLLRVRAGAHRRERRHP